jgi:hypothetical protein
MNKNILQTLVRHSWTVDSMQKHYKLSMNSLKQNTTIIASRVNSTNIQTINRDYYA